MAEAGDHSLHRSQKRRVRTAVAPAEDDPGSRRYVEEIMPQLPKGWPKDTNPRAIARAQQVATMTLPQAKHSLRMSKIDLDVAGAVAAFPTMVQRDPVALAIQGIINGF